MTEQTNHTDRDQKLKTELQVSREMKTEGEKRLQAFLDYMGECNQVGAILNWKATQVSEFKQVASIQVLFDPEKRRYD